MAKRQIQATFMRGGTSRGLFFSAISLARFNQLDREKIICQAMGSPDPGGRQIDGLGGGLSSLSKCAIVSPPGGGMSGIARTAKNPFPGVDWADDSNRFHDWDAVYRFGQVPVKGTEIDWGSTCGNLVAAAAQFAVESGAVRNKLITSKFFESNPEYDVKEFKSTDKVEYTFPLRLLAANVGKTITVKIPLVAKLNSTKSSIVNWDVVSQGTARIAGVPGTSAPILVEDPLDQTSILPTGNQIDTLQVEGQKVECTIINAGLPTIFVSSSTPYLDLSQELLLSQPSIIDGSPLMNKLEKIREEVCKSISNSTLTPSAPKICLVSPSLSYQSTEGVQIDSKEMDCLVRAVSVGNIHRTIPATALAALSCGLSFPNSIIYQAVKQSGSNSINEINSNEGEEKSFTISVGQPSGVSSCSISTNRNSEGTLFPKAVQMLRTARTIMKGLVESPDGVDFDPEIVRLAEMSKKR